MCSVIYSGSVQLNVVCILHKLCSRGFVLFVFLYTSSRLFYSYLTSFFVIV